MKLLLIYTCFLLNSNLSSQDTSALKELFYVDLCDLEGQLSEWKGQVIFISFWSKTCGPCIRGFNNNNKLRNELTEKGVILLNVSIDSKEDGLIAYNRYRPVGINSITKSFEQAQDDFEIFNLPVYVTIDEKGRQVEYDRMQWGNLSDFVEWYEGRKE